MPAVQRGQVFKLGGGSWAYRYRDHGRRRQVGGFKTKGEARDALDSALELVRRGRSWPLAGTGRWPNSSSATSPNTRPHQ